MNNRCYLINAPAGSGKTTFIHNKIMEITLAEPRTKILCITYTNRAMNELNERFQYYSNNNLEVYTIHSFVNNFIDIYFKNRKIIDEYFIVYKNEITSIIENQNDEKNLNKISKYKEKYGEKISFEIVKSNVLKIYYNETNFNGYLYGGLSHDELIRFFNIICNKYENILFKLANIYDYIFIDEYQDTPFYVLETFYNALKYSKSKLYLLGDRMQQIYDNNNQEFEKLLRNFNTNINLKYNYRSTDKIVKVLNNIYGNEKYIQESKANDNYIQSKVLCIITDDYESITNEFKDYYKLFLLNSEKYNQIGAKTLYSSISSVSDYSFNGKYNVSDALNSNIEENKDALFKPMYIINYIVEMYDKNNFGAIIRVIQKYNKIFDIVKINISDFSQIKNLKLYIKKIHDEYYNKDNSISDFLIKIQLLKQEYFDIITQNTEYEQVMNTKISEFVNYVNYIKNSDCSTQHGVKGEGHDNILFVSESSTNPNINIYEFYKLYSKKNICMDDLDMFNKLYLISINKLEEKIGISINKLKKESYDKFYFEINETIQEIYDSLNSYEYFDLIKDKYNIYISKRNVTSLKDFLKKGYFTSILFAYKIFYVGCSRARKNLVVLIKKSNIVDYQKELIKKLEDIGFEVVIK